MDTTIYRSDINTELLLHIPPYIDREQILKRKISKEAVEIKWAMISNYEQQVSGYLQMKEFAQLQTGGIYVLQGWAGSGKTFILSALVEELLLINPHQNIAITAPTNQAVKILKQYAEYTHPALRYSTIHKLLGLKEQIDSKGNRDFVQMFGETNAIDSINFLVIDETSQLPDKLYNMIYPYVEKSNLKILFIGDPAQIPPIGMADCIPFDTRMQLKHNMKVFQLTEVVRQAKGNPIIAASLQLRDNVTHRDPLKIRESKLDEKGHGIVYLGIEDKKLLMDFLRLHFCSENFTKNPDFIHIIAYKNDTVRDFNKIIRRFIYGKERANSEAYIIGEKLIANKPIMEELDTRMFIIFQNSQEFELESFEIKTLMLYEMEFKYYSAKVVCNEAGEIKKERIKIIHEDSEETLIKAMEHLKKMALAETKGTYKATQAWKAFYRFQDIFADVSYGYAITTHKAQGSSYDNVLVVEGDIDTNWNITERNRIKYTAFTRPRNKLVVCS